MNRGPDHPCPNGRDRLVSVPGGQGVQIGDHSFQINVFAESRAVRWPHQVGAIPRLADCYQPREHISATLTNVAEGSGTTILTQVLSGLGGVGKSQLVAAHARHQWDTGAVDLLLWVTASSREAILTGYAQAAREIGDPVPEAVEEAAGRFLAWLQRTDRAWLVVLDDLADPAHLRRWWPDGPHGHTVVTTRRTDAALFGHGRQRVPIGVFTPADAHAYLASRLDAQHYPDRMHEADQLAADLGHLPLALAQASAFILDRADICAGYRTRLADRRRRLGELFPHDALADDYQSTVAATWSISLDAADALAPVGLARPLLQVASVLDPNGFPTGLIDTPAIRDHLRSVRTLPPDAADPGRGEVDVQDSRDALANLVRLSLIDRLDPATIGGPGGARVHALVQRATLQHLDPSTVARLVQVAADALMQIWPDIEHDPQLGQILRSNLTALRRHDPDALWKPAGHGVLFRAGYSLGDAGLLAAAVTYWIEAVKESDHHLGPDHPDTLAARANLARWRGQAGDPSGAATALEHLLADLLRVLGAGHDRTLSIRDYLAHWRGEAGDRTGAVDAYEQLLIDQLRVRGPDHADTIITRGNLARSRVEAGDPVRAVAAYEDLLSDMLRVLGPDHRDTLTARHNLAHSRRIAGDSVGAVAAYEKLLPDRLRVLGADHPQTLATRDSLARSLGDAGDPARAATAFKELLPELLRVLGPDHPQTLVTRANLAAMKGRAGNPADAATAYEQLLTDQLRVLGPDHPQTLNTRDNLARWRGQAGDVDGAVDAYEQLLSDMLRVLGPDHLDSLSTRTNLASMKAQAGDPTGAAAAYRQLLPILLQRLGPDHPDTFVARANLAYARGQAGDPSGAAIAYEQVFADLLRVLGPDHPITGSARRNLAYWQAVRADSAGAVPRTSGCWPDVGAAPRDGQR
jgi:hypothetical protein